MGGGGGRGGRGGGGWRVENLIKSYPRRLVCDSDISLSSVCGQR